MQRTPESITSLSAAHPARRSLPQNRKPRARTAIDLLNEFLDNGKRERLYSPATVWRYRVVTGEFLNFIGELDLALVRPRDIRAYLASMLERGASDQTLRQTLCALRSLFRYLEMCEVVAVSPARAVQTRRMRRRLPKPLSEDDVNKLIDSAENLRDKALIEFTYSSGCRIAEVAGARIENLNWSNRTVAVIGKGDKERLVPLGTRAIALLQSYLGTRTEGWLFQAEGHHDQGGALLSVRRLGKWQGKWRENYAFDPKGRLTWTDQTKLLGKMSEVTREQAKAELARIVSSLPPRPRPTKAQPLTTRAIRDIVRKTALRAGLVHVSPHRLRHSFATHLHDHGADILTISRLLGHSSVATTQIYTDVSQKKARETLERCHPHWTHE